MEVKTRKRRVCWTPFEFMHVVEYMDQHPELKTSKAIRQAQNLYLQAERHMSPTGITEMVRRPDFDSKVERARIGIENRKVKSPPPLLEFDFQSLPPPPVSTSVPELSLEEKIADKLADRIAEKVAAILLPQLEDRINDLMFSSTVSKVILQREEFIHRQTTIAQTTMTKPRRRIDIVGLLNDQSQVVKNFIADWDVKARFILSEHISKVDKLAPDVVLCSRFISHDAQDRAKASGSKIHYANGAATSVINLLENIFQRTT